MKVAHQEGRGGGILHPVSRDSRPWKTMKSGSDDPGEAPRKGRIPTWLGLLLILAAVVLAGAAGLVLERLTAPR